MHTGSYGGIDGSSLGMDLLFVFHKPNECNVLDSLFEVPSYDCVHNVSF